jgi:type VI secretion system protein ImpL
MKPPVLAAAVVVWVGLVVVGANLLKLHGLDFWIMVAGLALLGVVAAAALWWFTREKEHGDSIELLDEKDELAVLCREAEAHLAKSSLGPNAKLTTLPLFLILGERGSTKTTAVLNSGLEPELIAGQVYHDNTVVPTSTANIWFARNHLLFEAAEPVLNDEKRWSALIRRIRPGRLSAVSKTQQAPRAAVVCIGSDTFLSPGGSEASIATARKLHGRLNEISKRLGISFPVYVIFTRLDRANFFHDFAATMTNEEAFQVFGTTLPTLPGGAKRIYSEEQSARLTEAFDTLYYSLCGKRPDLLARENDDAKLPGSYEFPREFRKLKNGIVKFLVELGRPSQLTSAPFLRGFYFIGVRPVIVRENSPAPVRLAPESSRARFSSEATSLFRASEPLAPPPPQTAPAAASQRRVPQWVFLPHLFTDVLLADRDALASSGASSQTSKARRLWLALAAATCLFFAIAFSVSFSNNRRLEDDVLEAIRGISSSEASSTDLPSLDALRRLDTLRQSLAQLSAYNTDGVPLSLRWGLYTGDSLYPRTRRAYFDKFHQLLLGGTQANLLATLRSLPNSVGPADDYQSPYDTLKSYLITTSNHEKSSAAYLTPVLMTRWAAGRTVDPARLDLARKQFDFYAGELKTSNPFSSENQSGPIENGRRYLSKFAGTERVYQAMLVDGNKNPAVNYAATFPDAAGVVSDTYVVAGAFTKKGWKTIQDDLKHVERFFSGEQWVLGDQISVNLDQTKLQADLGTRYSSDFVSAWKTYLQRGAVLPFHGIPDAAMKLQKLSGNQSPLLELFYLASQNTAVDNPAVASALKALYAVVPAGAPDQYISGANADYMKALVTLQVAFDQIAQAQGAPDAAAVGQTLTNAQNALLTTKQMAQGFGVDPNAHLEGTVEKLLEDPIKYVQDLLRGLGPTELNGKGKTLCAQLSPVLGQFPFNSASKTEATPADVNAAFKPKEGAVWAFSDQNLAKYLIPQGTHFVQDPNSAVPINDKFITFLNHAKAFSDMAYPAGSADPHFTYTVKPFLSDDIQNLKLTIDGQAAEFSADTAAKSFTWQPAGAHGVQVTAKFKNGDTVPFPSYPGLWAVFQWVDDADAQSGDTLEWRLKGGKGDRPIISPVTNQPVKVRFTIINPVFQKGYFSGLRCVSDIAKQ